MNHCDKIIWDLECHSSRLNKESIIQNNLNNTELFEGFQLALSPYITFGVKKVPIHTGPDGQGFSWDNFKELCNKLHTRQLTGDDARFAIELALSASKKDQWNNWYRRILIKDLRCGVSEKTINKVKKGTVPVFECMLSHDGANHEKKISGVKLLEPKLDGVRCITIIDHEARTVIQYTRNGKVLENFTHISDSLLSHIDEIGRSFVLDGEVVSHSFQDVMKQVHRKSDVQASDAKLMLFDIVPLDEFKKGKSSLGQLQRSSLLKTLKPIFDKCNNIEIIPQVKVNLEDLAGKLQFKEFNKKAIDAGFEGIMIKEPDAPYECKRSTSWLKQKPFIEVTLTVINVEEGTGKNEGRLGALICKGIDDGKHIMVNVGSGFTDEQRLEFWTYRSELKGQLVEIRADALTINQDSTEIWSLRFPRFLRFRGFKQGEKI